MPKLDASQPMFHQPSFLLLLALPCVLAADNSIDICKNSNFTLAVNQNNAFRRATVFSERLPVRAKTTCNVIVNFNAAATISLTLVHLTNWEILNSSAGAQGYVLEYKNGEKQFVFSNNPLERSSVWTNATSNTCPYLYIRRTSALNSANAVQLNLNETTIINATSIVIELRSVPETAWCNILITVDASTVPADYCQAKEELYCNGSAQCLQAKVRCNGQPDCDRGEDEISCSEYTPEVTDNFGRTMVAVISVASLGVMFIVTAVVMFSKRQQNKRLKFFNLCNAKCGRNKNSKVPQAKADALDSALASVGNASSSDRLGQELLECNKTEALYYLLESPVYESLTGKV